MSCCTKQNFIFLGFFYLILHFTFVWFFKISLCNGLSLVYAYMHIYISILFLMIIFLLFFLCSTFEDFLGSELKLFLFSHVRLHPHQMNEVHLEFLSHIHTTWRGRRSSFWFDSFSTFWKNNLQTKKTGCHKEELQPIFFPCVIILFV